MMWDLFNTGLRIVCMALAVVAITRFRGYFNRTERIGLSFASGTAFMTIDVIWYQKDSYMYWSGAAFTFGVCVFLWGMIRRKGAHDRANRRQVQESAAYLRGRGLL